MSPVPGVNAATARDPVRERVQELINYRIWHWERHTGKGFRADAAAFIAQVKANLAGYKAAFPCSGPGCKMPTMLTPPASSGCDCLVWQQPADLPFQMPLAELLGTLWH